MIRPADREGIAKLRCTDPFCTRICSLYESYGDGYDFTGFWVQELGGETVSAVSRFEDKFSLHLTDGSDLEEIAAFLHFQGAGAVMYDDRFSLDFGNGQAIRGQVLAYRGAYYISELEIYQPDFKALYRLLESCASDIFRVPPYLSFLSDVTHRMNLRKCTVLATGEGDIPASSVMTVSETTAAVIIGAVATHPAHRRRGLSRELVRTLASRIREEGREVYVFSASGENTRFYLNSGFEVVADFCEAFA